MADFQYQVDIRTGDVDAGGTDAGIYLTIYGSLGQTREIRIDNLAKAPDIFTGTFERGQTNVVRFAAGDVGEMRQVRVRSDNTGIAPSWFLASLTITVSGRQTIFNCNQWLATNGFRLHHYLAPGREPSERPFADLLGGTNTPVQYKVRIETSSEPLAGTDALVSIEMRGSSGQLVGAVLGKSGFQTGQRTEFEISGPDVGIFREVTLSHDNSGFFSGWTPAAVEVENTRSGQRQRFPFGASIDGSQALTATPRGPRPGLRRLETAEGVNALQALPVERVFDELDLTAEERVALERLNFHLTRDSDGNREPDALTLEERFAVQVDSTTRNQFASALGNALQELRRKDIEQGGHPVDPAAVDRLQERLNDWTLLREDALSHIARLDNFIQALEDRAREEVNIARALLIAESQSFTPEPPPPPVRSPADMILGVVNVALNVIVAHPDAGVIIAPIATFLSIMNLVNSGSITIIDPDAAQFADPNRDRFVIRAVNVELDLGREFARHRAGVALFRRLAFKSFDLFSLFAQQERALIAMQRRLQADGRGDLELNETDSRTGQVKLVLPAQLAGLDRGALLTRRNILTALVPLRLLLKAEFLTSTSTFPDDTLASTSCARELEKLRNDFAVLGVSRAQNVQDLLAVGDLVVDDLYYRWRLDLYPVNGANDPAAVRDGSLSLLDHLFSVFSPEELRDLVSHYSVAIFFSDEDREWSTFGSALGWVSSRGLAPSELSDTPFLRVGRDVPTQFGLRVSRVPGANPPINGPFPKQYVSRSVTRSERQFFTTADEAKDTQITFYYYMDEFSWRTDTPRVSRAAAA